MSILLKNYKNHFIIHMHKTYHSLTKYNEGSYAHHYTKNRGEWKNYIAQLKQFKKYYDWKKNKDFLFVNGKCTERKKNIISPLRDSLS